MIHLFRCSLAIYYEILSSAQMWAFIIDYFTPLFNRSSSIYRYICVMCLCIFFFQFLFCFLISLAMFPKEQSFNFHEVNITIFIFYDLFLVVWVIYDLYYYKFMMFLIFLLENCNFKSYI